MKLVIIFILHLLKVISRKIWISQLSTNFYLVHSSLRMKNLTWKWRRVERVNTQFGFGRAVGARCLWERRRCRSEAEWLLEGFENWTAQTTNRDRRIHIYCICYMSRVRNMSNFWNITMIIPTYGIILRFLSNYMYSDNVFFRNWNTCILEIQIRY